jgi:hypothetical protein
MAFKPNFKDDAELTGDHVFVEGKSGDTAEDLEDIVDIRVVLVQGDRVASQTVDKVVSDWTVSLPVSDEEGDGEDFHAGAAAAFGVESRRTNFTTITWAGTVTIREQP